ncbi:MAG: leucine--tRNA ligase, partial [Chloroflexi bacterium]|nr:leucine--tRNA ligase [Chloroflexota bacterium]
DSVCANGDSSNPQYYRWTQWFFLLLFKRNLAYQAMAAVWWCPSCKTTLANEEVHNGHCWRCDSLVERREMKQWFFRITAYADRLLEDLKTIDWPESVKLMQENWIGRSEGALVHFQAEDGADLPIFTTRPDTLFGCTFFVIAPEHPLVERLTAPAQRAAVDAYIAQVRRTTEIERTSTARLRTGVPIGTNAINPVNGERIPIWIADYVLSTYGTGMIMAVPAHDERDFTFAQHYNLPIRVVIQSASTPPPSPPPGAFTGDGQLVDSGPYTGLSSAEAKRRITADLKASGKGEVQVNFKLRDWLISRQRYWGAPIPIIHCPEHGPVAVPEEQLPVELPEVIDWQPTDTGRSPLESAIDWVNTACPICHKPAQRETDTMGGFACSSWYFLRFCSPHETSAPFNRQAVNHWMPVDLYVGGLEHTVMHLLYARFWTKVMYDAGLVSFIEPFIRYRPQGVVLSPRPDKEGHTGKRMSKSRGNVITPDSVVEEYGADALRLYELFIGPFDQNLMWDEKGVNGVARFLNRVWDLATQPYSSSRSSSDSSLKRQLHKTIKKVTEDLQELRFNTAISALMILVNDLTTAIRDSSISNALYQECIRTLILLLAPMAVFLSEELWHRLSGQDSVHRQQWPEYSPDLARDETVEIAIQINSKLRDHLPVPVDAGQSQVQELVLALPRVREILNGKTPTKVFYAPGRLINIIIR